MRPTLRKARELVKTTRGMSRLARALGLSLLALAGWAAAVEAQVFVASRPHPEFTIGPLFVRASVRPELGPVTIDIFFGLVLPTDHTAAESEQDIFLLWPSTLISETNLGAPDRSLIEYVEKRGVTVVSEGRATLSSRAVAGTRGERPREAVPGGAPFVTFVREGGALGLSSPVSLIKIPWTPKLANPLYLTNLKMVTKGLIKDKPATWLEHAFWGSRHRLTVSFHEVRSRALFPMYMQHRDRVIRLADEPAQIIAEFADSDHLKIDEIYPQSSRRQLSETRDKTDTVSLYLDRSEGLSPQTLTVQFGYFRGLQSWAPVLIPALAFLLGNLAGPILREAAKHLRSRLAARVHVGRRVDGVGARDRGVVLTRETLARIQPGQTTVDEVIRLAGPEFEQHEQLGAPNRHTMVYRGRRVTPERRRSYGWLSTVDHWTAEDHEVEIDVEDGRVRDLQARVRRSRLLTPEGA